MQHPISLYRLLVKGLSLCLLSFVLTSCQAIVTPRVILWHSWQDEQAEAINAAVERFTQIFDDVVVVASYVPSDELIERYIEAAPQGLGPDLFIGSSDNLSELAESQLIMSLADDELNLSVYYTSALAPLTYNEQLYGVPFAMQPLAMYYNLDLIETPAATLSELLAQAEAGAGVAISTQFGQVLWGVQAFGGQIVDENGYVALNQGALTNWLNWLLTVNSNPQIFLSRDTTTLRQLFVDGRVTYYTGSASELTQIQSLMEANKVGVAPLPSGPNGTSGPLMQVDALMFNPSSSQLSHEKARELAIFLTNLEQETAFMRDLQLVPANRRVRVDLRTYPAIAGFIAQTRTAIAIPHLPQVARLLEQGDDMLLRVLEGVVEPNVATDDLTKQINAEFGLTPVETVTGCELSGELVLWHSLTDSPADYLMRFANSLSARCSRFSLTLEYIPRSELVTAYLEAFTNNEAPDMVLTSSDNLQTLVEAESVLTIRSDRMQAFSPISQATVTLGGVAYGIPMSLISNVFYYNSDFVADAPVTTDELLVDASNVFSASRNINDMFWTVTAYNGISVGDEKIIPDLEQLTAWLTWLSRMDETEHIRIVANNFLRRAHFVDSESAYYVDSNLDLMALSTELDEALSVALFPTGTSSFASPLVTSMALFVNPKSEQTDTAIQFGEVLTAVDEQENMVETLRWIPVNITADQNITTDPLLRTIADVMQTGIVITHNPEQVLAELNRAIDRVFRGEQAPEIIAQDLFDALQTTEVSE